MVVAAVIVLKSFGSRSNEEVFLLFAVCSASTRGKCQSPPPCIECRCSVETGTYVTASEEETGRRV